MKTTKCVLLDCSDFQAQEPVPYLWQAEVCIHEEEVEVLGEMSAMLGYLLLQ